MGVIMAAITYWRSLCCQFLLLSDKTKTKWDAACHTLSLECLPASFVSVHFGNVYYNSLVGVIVMMGLILIVMNIYHNPAVALMPDITQTLRSKANGIINFTGYLGHICRGLAIVFPVGEFGKKLESRNAFIAF